MSLKEALKKEQERQWENVEAGLEQIIQSGVLASEGMRETPDSLREQIKGLRDKPYTIAVCGDVKSGKSTLLNALLFGDTVLPEFETPMTAKLTFIRHSEEERFEVEFYDQDEWREFEEECKGEGRQEAWRQLNQRLEKCQAQGVSKQTYVCSPRRANLVGRDLKGQLPEYVSDVMTGRGKYTPFVKSVTLYVNRPELENLQIVDTPGLNDSNVVNSEQTTRWIREAHAVVYVLSVSGPRQPDLQFFQTHFPSTAVESRLFVQNKIDLAPDYESAKADIRRYGKTPEYRSKGLFGDDETICSYSGMAVLIQAKLGNGLELTEGESDLIRKKPKLAKRETFDGNPDGLEKKLAEKLFAKEGAVRLKTASGWLMRVYQAALAACERDIAQFERQLPDCGRDESTLAGQIKKHQAFKRKLDDEREKQKMEFIDELKDSLGKIRKELDEAEEAICGEVRAAVIQCGGTDSAVLGSVPYALWNAKRKAFRNIGKSIRNVRKSLWDRLHDIQREISDSATESGIMDRVSVQAISFDIEGELDAALEQIEVDGDALYDSVPGRFVKWLTSTSAEECAKKVLDIVAPIVGENIQQCYKSLYNLFDEAFMGEFTRILDAFKEYCDDRQRELEMARKDLDGAKERRKVLERNLKEAKARKAGVERAERDMKQLLGRAS